MSVFNANNGDRPRSTYFKSGDIPTIDPQTVLLKGFLTKEGGSWKSWKKRFFVLSTIGELIYYEDETLTKPKGALNCRSAEVHPLPTDGRLHFEIVSDVFGSEDLGRRLKLLAENEEQLCEWIQAIRMVSCLYGDRNPTESGTTQSSNIEMDSEPLC
jgi:hypothetical protein